MYWKVEKIEGCTVVPQYCYAVSFEGFDGESDQYVQAGGDFGGMIASSFTIGFTQDQANTVASILNKQIEDTEASLKLNTFNVKPTKEIN